MKKYYYVYIVASKSDVLYIGVTNNLVRRMDEHRSGAVQGFSKRYGCNRLLYYEYTSYINDALAFEKVLKSWSRKKKVELIERHNPSWKDLWDEIL